MSATHDDTAREIAAPPPSAPDRAARSASAAEAAPATGRLDWVDAAKGMGIILVVIGHGLGGLIDSDPGVYGSAFRTVFFAIYAFHMPMFFLLSGLFVQGRVSRQTGKFGRSLFTKIAWPYFLWSTIQLGVLAVAASLVNNPPENFWLAVLNLPIHSASQFWFLHSLFLLHLTSLVVLPRLGPVALLLGAFALRSLEALVPLPEMIRVLADMAPYYALGVLLGTDGVEKLVGRWPAWGRYLVMPAVAIAVSFVVLDALALELYDPPFALAPSNALAGTAWRFEGMGAALALTVAMLALCMSRPLQHRWLVAIGRLSFAIFILHILFEAGSRIVLTKFLGVQDQLVVFLLIAPIGLFGPLIALAVLDRLRLSKPLGLR